MDLELIDYTEQHQQDMDNYYYEGSYYNYLEQEAISELMEYFPDKQSLLDYMKENKLNIDKLAKILGLIGE